MTDVIKPTTNADVLETIQWASNEKKTLKVIGRGTKTGWGRPVVADKTVDMSALSGIIDYQPNELFVRAKSGTPVSTITAALANENQQLMFEPPDFGPLLGGDAGQGTLGGLIACNMAGSRRIQAGSARDNFLGFHAVSGRGEEFKSGGQVVKNVTGFDLSKLITGSYGTLAVLTDVTFKVLPSPEKIRTVLIQWSRDGIYDHGGVQAMTEAMGSANEVSGAAHVPALVAAKSSVDYVSGTGSAITAIRVEGPGPSVEFRCAALIKLLSKFGKVEELHTQNSNIVWKEISDVAYFSGNQSDALWRLSVPPTEGSRVALRILEGNPGDVIYDWAGGLVWLLMATTDNASEARIRKHVNEVGGHATLVRGPDSLRTSVPVFHPQDDSLSGVSRRVKEGFDPNGILNPGRMYEGV